MAGRLEDKVAIVTGSSRGIGAAIVRAFVEEGARVVGVARSGDALDALRASLGDGASRFVPRVADVTSSAAARDVVRETLDRFGRIDILVNNAGVGHFAPVTELAEEAWDEMMAVNLKAPFLWTQAVLPHMMERRDGHIIMISSVAGTTTFVNGAGYCASKWGLMALADTLRQEVRPYELRVTAVCPGSVQTHFGGTPPRDYSLRPEDVAHTVVEVAAAPKRVIYGTVIMRPLVPGDRQ
ncbi:short-chain dehydrogenase/reductase SDR [Thermaerobacter marianensis DSM 12885]|uniref:Short-chain dehydrogenase/reductase SDR n=1 Tax=Thermaerobacter marianensis (strain ATCC 700841 / DSM 12885 / JCM 10246 / 7p75a) TaxID=644966 RepID=E6SIJ7_THEM7|nr:SDR family oxidoreductase [Thermaerobacter marianensis]ADU50903.1 short-chain dehydrogenase/reductase SDR [Thermaerobacter marianensis DSM 12885]